MNDGRRRQIVNAAQSYERIFQERRRHFKAVGAAFRAADAEAIRESKAQFHDAGRRLGQSEKLLARLTYGRRDHFRVGDVIYIACAAATIWRIPLADVPDLTAETCDAAT